MAINWCNLCNEPCLTNGSIGNNNQEEVWRRLVAQVLCAIYNNDPNVVQSVQLEQIALTAAQLTAGFSTYADASFIDSALKLKRLRVINKTDADIEISLNGGSDTFIRVVAGSETQIDVGNYLFTAQDDFQVRIATGMTAGIGNLYLEGGY